MSTVTVDQKSPSASRSRRTSKIIRMIIALVMIVFALFPVAWAISASINPTGNLASQTLIPDNAGLENYRKLFNDYKFTTWMWNSMKISVSVTLLSLFITTTTAFGFSRFRFYGRGTLLKSILLIQVFPAILAMVAIFALVQQLG